MEVGREVNKEADDKRRKAEFTLVPLVILALCIPPLYIGQSERLTEWGREAETDRRRGEGGDADTAARRGRQYDVTRWEMGRGRWEEGGSRAIL